MVRCSEARGFARATLPMNSKGIWSWQRNPFVGTREYNGLLSVLMLINSTDLKNDNNEVYEVEGEPREQARRWYVVKDLGASLGETGRVDPRRGYLDGFEREPFLTGVEARSCVSPFAAGIRNCCSTSAIERSAVDVRADARASPTGNGATRFAPATTTRRRQRGTSRGFGRRPGRAGAPMTALARTVLRAVSRRRANRGGRSGPAGAAARTDGSGRTSGAPRSAAAGQRRPVRAASLRADAPAGCGRSRRACSRSGRGAAARRRGRRRSSRRKSFSPWSARWSCWWSAPASRARSASSAPPGSCATARRSRIPKTPA